MEDYRPIFGLTLIGRYASLEELKDGGHMYVDPRGRLGYSYSAQIGEPQFHDYGQLLRSRDGHADAEHRRNDADRAAVECDSAIQRVWNGLTIRNPPMAGIPGTSSV